MSVFYLKHRPRKISELDLPEVSKTLTVILTSKERPGSFLLAGPKGSGKTSAARLLAKSVNCEKPMGIEACGKCGNCIEIEAGKSMDIIEIDGASNRGIDDMRLIKERAYLLPSKLKIKVFVIDEVHMLTKEAFNALLKILEEPPRHTLFILCTTDADKIPETVLSRLIRIDFRKGSREELRGSLERVIRAEGLKVEKEAVSMVVDKSDGSFRNLHKTINEIFMEHGKKFGVSEVEKYFADRVGDYDGGQLEEDLRFGRTKKILETLEKMAAKGVDFSHLRADYLEYFQKRLLAGFCLEKDREGLALTELEKFLQLLIEAGRQEKFVEIDQLPLELAVVDFAKDFSPEKSEEFETEKPEEKAEEKPITKVDLTMAVVEEKWPEVLAAVKPFNHSVEAFMRSARPKRVEENRLILEVFYPFHKDRLEEEKNRKIVEEGLAKIFDCRLLLNCVLSEGERKPRVAAKTMEVESSEKNDLDETDLYDAAKEIFG